MVYLLHRFGHWFELPLLFQSIIMNVTMMMLISLCVSIRKRGQLIHNKEHVFTGKFDILKLVPKKILLPLNFKAIMICNHAINS